MAKDDDLDKKLNELDEKLDVVSIRKYYKARLIKRINKGEVGLLPELEQLEKIEQGGDSPESTHGKLGTPPTDSGSVPFSASEAEKEPEIPGIPSHLRIRRYTVTPAALDQRKKAGGAKRPGAKRNKNAWKHGKFAQGCIQSFIKPCKSWTGLLSFRDTGNHQRAERKIRAC